MISSNMDLYSYIMNIYSFLKLEVVDFFLSSTMCGFFREACPWFYAQFFLWRKPCQIRRKLLWWNTDLQRGSRRRNGGFPQRGRRNVRYMWKTGDSSFCILYKNDNLLAREEAPLFALPQQKAAAGKTAATFAANEQRGRETYDERGGAMGKRV